MHSFCLFFSKYIFGHFVEVIPIGYHCSRRCSRYLCVSISLRFGPRGPARHHTGTWRPSSRASSRARRAHYWSRGPPGVIPGLQHGVRASAISTGPRLSISTLQGQVWSQHLCPGGLAPRPQLSVPIAPSERSTTAA